MISFAPWTIDDSSFKNETTERVENWSYDGTGSIDISIDFATAGGLDLTDGQTDTNTTVSANGQYQKSDSLSKDYELIETGSGFAGSKPPTDWQLSGGEGSFSLIDDGFLEYDWTRDYSGVHPVDGFEITGDASRQADVTVQRARDTETTFLDGDLITTGTGSDSLLENWDFSDDASGAAIGSDGGEGCDGDGGEGCDGDGGEGSGEPSASYDHLSTASGSYNESRQLEYGADEPGDWVVGGHYFAEQADGAWGVIARESGGSVTWNTTTDTDDYSDSNTGSLEFQSDGVSASGSGNLSDTHSDLNTDQSLSITDDWSGTTRLTTLVSTFGLGLSISDTITETPESLYGISQGLYENKNIDVGVVGQPEILQSNMWTGLFGAFPLLDIVPVPPTGPGEAGPITPVDLLPEITTPEEPEEESGGDGAEGFGVPFDASSGLLSIDHLGFDAANAGVGGDFNYDSVNDVEPSSLVPSEGFLDGIQTTLDVAGLTPGLGIIPDVLNTGISLFRGDWVGAGANALAAVPIIGQFTKGAQLGVKGVKAADKLIGAGNAVDNAIDTAKAIDKSGIAPNRTVIGKIKDLDNLAPGENTLLKHLPDQGTPRANWRQNSSVLRQEIRKGNPIRDASLNPDGSLKNFPGSFLEAERNLLRNQGWTFDPSTGLWSPAK